MTRKFARNLYAGKPLLALAAFTSLITLQACSSTQKSGGRPESTVEVRPVEGPVIMASANGDITPPFKTNALISFGAAPGGPERLVAPRSFDMIHQVIRISFDWNRKAVVGATTITFSALNEPISSIDLDAVNMNVTGVSRGETPLQFTYDKSTLKIQLGGVLMPNDPQSITIRYETVAPKRGIYFIDRKQVIWTQGEMIDTRHWVPTVDRPDDKTTWEMLVTVPKEHKVLSNGKLASVKDLGTSHEWHWKQELPASTYLYSIVAGNYEIIKDKSWNDVTISHWTYPDSVEAAKRGFAKTRDMIDVFSRKTGVRYPWPKYDQAAVPDFIFGGMENVSASTQSDKIVLIPAKDSLKDAQPLVAHEAAHQWFGNIVTLKDWSHSWLNEGFATFLETIFWEEDGQHDRAALNRVNDQKSAIAADVKARRPLVYNRWNKDPLELFLSGHIYPKGAAVLDMLRQTVGEANFWKSVNKYLVDNAYKSVTTEDLKTAFEKTTKQDLHYFFKQWVYGAGIPAFQVAHRYDSASRHLILTVLQVQPRDSSTGIFSMDVDILATNDTESVTRTAYVRGETTIVSIPMNHPPKAIRWDPADRWLDVIDFPRSPNMLLYQLQKGDVLARREALELLKNYRSDQNVRVVMQRVSTSDPVPALREMAKAALQN